MKPGSNIHKEHLELFETATLGVTWTSITLGIAKEKVYKNFVRQVMLTILPQTGVIIIPFVFAYIWASFKGSGVGEALVRRLSREEDSKSEKRGMDGTEI